MKDDKKNAISTLILIKRMGSARGVDVRRSFYDQKRSQINH